MIQPDISYRQYISPYGTTTPITFQQTAPALDALPVLRGNDSDNSYFRIYNNYALNSGVADALNVVLTTYDGVGVHTASMPVASQGWVHVLENGYGENSSTPGLYTVFSGSETVIGGAGRTYSFDVSSGGSAGKSRIRAWTSGAGCGFVEIKSFARVPSGAVAGSSPFAFSITYDWFS
jgi:hypothetical protein